MPQLGNTGGNVQCGWYLWGTGAGRADSHSPTHPHHLAIVPYAREESGRGDSHAACLHCLCCLRCLHCVLPGNESRWERFQLTEPADHPFSLSDSSPSAHLPQGYNQVPRLGKTVPGRRLGSALAAVGISPLIYTAVSSDRLILQLCLEPTAGPRLWMNQLSLGLGFYFIIFLQLPSQAAKKRERGRKTKLADFVPCSCAPRLPAWLWDSRRREGGKGLFSRDLQLSGIKR